MSQRVAYEKWMQRAVEFTESLRPLPGKPDVDVQVAPPISMEAIDQLAKKSRLGIPEPLRRFLADASAHCCCHYWWEPPEQLQSQLDAVFHGSHFFWGGANFCDGTEISDLQECCLDWATSFKDEFPRDSRFWENSIPFIPVGNGDYLALYIESNPDDPPVVYLNHDGYGGSALLAASFDEFLAAWEDLGYVGGWLLFEFVNPETGHVDPKAHPRKTEILRTLLRGEYRPDHVYQPLPLTETGWLTSSKILELEKHLAEKVSTRKSRLFACACCRRWWDSMDATSKAAIETAERFADGLATDQDLNSAREAVSAQYKRPGASANSMGRAASGACSWHMTMFVAGEIVCRMDESAYRVAIIAHADLFRHIFGNPYHPITCPSFQDPMIIRLARRLYGGDQCAAELSLFLKKEGHDELAVHFTGSDHPKGCWALDLILDKG